jgi:phage head maturation protease
MLGLRPFPVFRDNHPCGIRALESGTFARISPSTTQLYADPATLTLLSIIVTNDRDTAGDLIEPDGLRNRNEYLKDPVVLWAHNRQTLPPVGTCVRLEVRPDRIVVETRFARGVAFAEDLFRLYARGVLRAWSLGFVPRKTSGLATRRGGRRGLRVEEWDLVEYSAAPVAACPGPLTAARRPGRAQDRLQSFTRPSLIRL